MDYIGNTYAIFFFEKYKREHDPLTWISHLRQACDNYQRDEVQQDKYFYSLNISIHTIADIKYHKKFKGKKYKRINYIYCPNLKI